MRQRLQKLLSIKSMVTLITTVVFAALALRGEIGSSEFLTVYTVVIGFYFGTQMEKNGGKGV